jgi:hypothetical protein
MRLHYRLQMRVNVNLERVWLLGIKALNGLKSTGRPHLCVCEAKATERGFEKTSPKPTCLQENWPRPVYQKSII